MDWILTLIAYIIAVPLVVLPLRVFFINRARKKVSAACEISEVREFMLGGYPQKVLLEGKSRDNPVLIFLHGGPGSPLPFNVGCRGLLPEMTDKHLMVIWDQLGSGINNYPMTDSFATEDLVEMTVDLIRAIRAEFPDNRLELFGVSFGSFLASQASLIVPELIDRIIVYGQITHQLFTSPDAYAALAEPSVPAKVRAEIAAIEAKGPDSYEAKDIAEIARALRRNTEAYLVRDGVKSPRRASKVVFDLMLGMVFSPDYRLRDAFALVRNGYRENTSIILGVVAADLRPVLEQVPLPYVIIQGEKDLVTSTLLVEEFMATAQNPHLTLRVVPDSAHYPGDAAIRELLSLRGENGDS